MVFGQYAGETRAPEGAGSGNFRNLSLILRDLAINGPILVLGGALDSMCPMEETVGHFRAQLEAHRFAHPFESRIYPHLGHFALPVRPYSSPLLAAERRYQRECAAERAESWRDTLRFLREW